MPAAGPRQATSSRGHGPGGNRGGERGTYPRRAAPRQCAGAVCASTWPATLSPLRPASQRTLIAGLLPRFRRWPRVVATSSASSPPRRAFRARARRARRVATRKRRGRGGRALSASCPLIDRHAATARARRLGSRTRRRRRCRRGCSSWPLRASSQLRRWRCAVVPHRGSASPPSRPLLTRSRARARQGERSFASSGVHGGSPAPPGASRDPSAPEPAWRLP